MQNKRSTFSLLFYINRSKAKKSGKCPIVGRISVDGKNTAFSTGLEILPSEWDADRGTATGKSQEITAINSKMGKIQSEISGNYKNLLEEKGYVTAESLKNALQGIGTKHSSVMQAFENLTEEKNKSVGVIIAKSTMVKYKVAMNHFRDFLKEKYGCDDIPFQKADIELIESYNKYLRIDLRMLPCTVKTNMIILRTVVLRAVKKKLILQDPFIDYRPEKIIIRRRWISRDELNRIMKIKLNKRSHIFTRDMFVFACFTGISYVDLLNLKDVDIHPQPDGSRMIIINRQKTGTPSCIPLLPIAEEILEKYRDSAFAGEGEKIFRMPTHQGMGKHLKVIAKAANVDKRLTFHMSRHTYSTTVCLSHGVPIESLSRMLGHSSIATTQIYAEVTRMKLNEDMTNLEKRIEGKYTLAQNDY